MEQHPLLRTLAKETIVRFSIRHPLSLVSGGLLAAVFILVPFLFWFDWRGWQWAIPVVCFVLAGFFAWRAWMGWQHSLFIETSHEYVTMVPKGLFGFEPKRWEKSVARLLTERESLGRQRFIVAQGEPTRRWVFRGMRPWVDDKRGVVSLPQNVDHAAVLARLQGADESVWRAVYDLLEKQGL